MNLPVTTVEERRLLRSAHQMQTRADGHAYIDAPGFQARARRSVLDSLLAKELLVEQAGRFARTAAGDAVLATLEGRGVAS